MSSKLRILVPVKRVIDYAVSTLQSSTTDLVKHIDLRCFLGPGTRGWLQHMV